MITLPDGNSVWVVQALRSRIGVRDAVNTVCGGRAVCVGEALRLGLVLSGLEIGVADVAKDSGCAGILVAQRLWYWMMADMFSGLLLDRIMVVTPAAVAISAAMSFVSIPPVPRLDPSVVVLTGIHEME